MLGRATPVRLSLDTAKPVPTGFRHSKCRSGVADFRSTPPNARSYVRGILRNGNGAVTASDITGTLDISNRFGRIRVTNAGRGVTIRSNNGDIEADNVTGATLITNSFGPVVVSNAKSDVTVQNQNGEIRATEMKGGAVPILQV